MNDYNSAGYPLVDFNASQLHGRVYFYRINTGNFQKVMKMMLTEATKILESLPDFAKAVRMYEKQGFIGLDEPLGKSEHTACNIWMIKEL